VGAHQDFKSQNPEGDKVAILWGLVIWTRVYPDGAKVKKGRIGKSEFRKSRGRGILVIGKQETRSPKSHFLWGNCSWSCWGREEKGRTCGLGFYQRF